jgi:proteasome lid subunit RPN8/RPN11
MTPELERIVHRIMAIAELRHPAEAVGMMIDDQVLELPNRSLKPLSSFLFTPADIALTLQNNNIDPNIWQRPGDIILWHTHPSGGVGPSRLDVQNKLQYVRHLVVTVTPEGPIPTWY